MGILSNIITGGAGELIKNVSDVVDKYVTTDKEREAAKQAAAEAIMQHQEKMADAAIEEERIAAQDRDSARKHDSDIATSANAPLLNKIIVPLLALIVVCGGGYLLWKGDTDLRLAVSNIIMMVLGFYYGTTAGSQRKQESIEKMLNKQP